MLSTSTCPMCESSRSKGLARCPCEIGDVRRGLVLLCLGWAGDQREFSREDKGWRLGNGIVATPWVNGKTIPEDAWDALDQIEARYAADLEIMMQSVRWIDGTPDKPGIYWLKLDSKGGSPFMTIGIFKLLWLISKAPADFEMDRERFFSGEMTDKEFSRRNMVLCFCLPNMHESSIDWRHIETLWNCQAYLLVQEPKENQ